MALKFNRIAVLGTLTRDTTTFVDGTQSHNFGGIHYTLLALASLFRGRGEILPVANVGRDAYSEICTALASDSILTQALNPVPENNNHVYLNYKSFDDREEVLKGLVRPVSLEHCIATCNENPDLDWFLVNMTSGRDVELETLEALRQRFSKTIQLDIHSLTLGFKPDGRRVPEKPVLWRRWVSCADWVQMNEAEARLLGDGEPLEDFGKRVLDLGPTGVLVTLGGQGCWSAFLKDGAVEVVRYETVFSPQRPFPTGCGDVFGAGFAYAMLQGCSPPAAIQIANLVASRKACFEPSKEILTIRDQIQAELAKHLSSIG